MPAGSWPRVDQRGGHGQPGDEVARGASPGDEDPGGGRHRRAGDPEGPSRERGWRAMFNSMPTATMVTSSDEPP